MENTAQTYDPNSPQRYEFEVTADGAKYDTAHNYKPLSDERYLQFIDAFDIRGDQKEVQTKQVEATDSLWNDLVAEVENIDLEEDQDFRDLIDYKEKEDSLNNYLAVAIVEPEDKASGKRRLSQQSNETVITEAYFNGKPVQQTHVLKKKNLEWQKRYDRIQAKRFKQEATKGLRRSAKIEYVPQDANIGKLYDEMQISATGFADGIIPLRFKTIVISYLFASKTDEKK